MIIVISDSTTSELRSRVKDTRRRKLIFLPPEKNVRVRFFIVKESMRAKKSREFVYNDCTYSSVPMIINQRKVA